MNEITPRWEWRSFGSHFGDAEIRLKERGADKLQHSDEIYLLSSVSDANVKIRDGLMDIKQLEQTDTRGFEQWRPVLKEAFPLSAAAIKFVFSSLGVASPLESTIPLTLDQLLAEVTADSRLYKLEVHKVRARYQLEACMAELTEVVANGKTMRTLAVESENSAHITAALHALGLEGVENVSYPRGLKQLVELSG
jgi:exopolyphosphatase / guanosine-5'-triphosphate,3'-diphosphate pyrophosphatase